MSPEPDKTRYSTQEMLATAKRLRSAGFSARTGKKLKRRTAQPIKEQRRVLRVLLLVGIVISAVIAGFTSWWLTRQQSEAPSKSEPSQFEMRKPSS
jgi:hypothetical protein